MTDGEKEALLAITKALDELGCVAQWLTEAQLRLQGPDDQARGRACPVCARPHGGAANDGDDEPPGA